MLSQLLRGSLVLHLSTGCLQTPKTLTTLMALMMKIMLCILFFSMTKHSSEYLQIYINFLSSRYLVPRGKAFFEPKESNRWDFWINECSERTFKTMFRIDRNYFDQLHNAIQYHQVFNTISIRPQAPVHHQLLVWLFRAGHVGNEASYKSLEQQFGIG
jgi:hypothetical protein